MKIHYNILMKLKIAKWFTLLITYIDCVGFFLKWFNAKLSLPLLHSVKENLVWFVFKILTRFFNMFIGENVHCFYRCRVWLCHVMAWLCHCNVSSRFNQHVKCWQYAKWLSVQTGKGGILIDYYTLMQKGQTYL